jgi:hypothetical protein
METVLYIDGLRMFKELLYFDIYHYFGDFVLLWLINGSVYFTHVIIHILSLNISLLTRKHVR